MQRRDLVAALVGGAIVLVLAGGVAWAAIPAVPGGVIQGCYDAGGNVKVVEALPCPSKYTPFQWNQRGPAGTNGRNGTNGTNGTNGVSVRSESEPAGANCANGGSKFTAAEDHVTYACNGSDGQDGADASSGAPWHILRRIVSVAPGGSTITIEQCPTGEFLLGGMFLEETNSQTVYTSRPSTTVPNAWEYKVDNSNATTSTLGVNMLTFCGTS